MFFNIIPRIKSKYAIYMILLVILNNIPLVIAKSTEQPIVVFAVTYCNAGYMVRLFESGKVEYRGSYGVKTLGRHEAQISTQAVKDLLKKFADAGSFNVTDDRIKLPFFGSEGEALYLRQGNKTATFFNVDDWRFSANPLFSLLRDETLRATNAKQWFDYTDLVSCKKYDRYFSYSIKVNKLKLIEN